MTTYRELEAFQAQCTELASLLGELSPSDWSKPTRCPPLSVRELVAHVAAVLPVWASFFETDAAAATTDRIQWWRYDVAASAPRIVDRAQKTAGERDDAALLAWLGENVEAAVAAFAGSAPDRVVARSSVALTAADLACVGVVEVGIHTMDIGHATLRGERMHPLATPIVVEVLEGLLGEPFPRKSGWDAKTKMLTATGRRALEPTERHTLGSLAAKLPVLT